MPAYFLPGMGTNYGLTLTQEGASPGGEAHLIPYSVYIQIKDGKLTRAEAEALIALDSSNSPAAPSDQTPAP